MWGARRPLFFAGIDLYRAFARPKPRLPRKEVIQSATSSARVDRQRQRNASGLRRY